MTTPIMPQCVMRECRHFEGWKPYPQPPEAIPASFPFCRAFPEGIPAEIAYGENLHLAPYPGDHGIRYEKKEE